MKLEKTLWVLTLFLAFVMVIPGMALAQEHFDLQGTWKWQAREVCNDFNEGTNSSEPERMDLCVVQDANDVTIYYYEEELPGWIAIWYGFTSYNFIGADLVESCCTSVLTGKVTKNGQSIIGTLVYFERQGYGLEDVCTAGYRFTMKRISGDTPCAP